jgi:hypothetical protein
MRKLGAILAASGVFLATTLGSGSANADVGIGLRGGTMGFGIDFDIGMTEKLNARLAYNFFEYDDTVEDTDVTYDSTLKIGSFSALLDWHVAGGGFRLSAGAVTSGPKFEVVGTPTSGTYEIGNNTYTASQVGDLRGEVEIGSSVAPYIGLGYGNVVGKNHRVTFLFDLGAIYGGTPDVNLAARCGASLTATQCARLQSDVQVEIQEIKDEMTTLKWYPVLNLGIGIRF